MALLIQTMLKLIIALLFIKREQLLISINNLCLTVDTYYSILHWASKCPIMTIFGPNLQYGYFLKITFYLRRIYLG